MIIYKIKCEWDMPLAQGFFLTRELAQEVIDKESWSWVGYTLEEVKKYNFASIEEVIVKEEV